MGGDGRARGCSPPLLRRGVACGPRGVGPRAPPDTPPPRVLDRQKGLVPALCAFRGGSPGATAPPLRPAEVCAERGRPPLVARGARAGKGKGVPALGDRVWPLSPLRAGSLPVAESRGGAHTHSKPSMGQRTPSGTGSPDPPSTSGARREVDVGQGGHSSGTVLVVTPKTSFS